jgi:geranylgeranyl pyrophosphate synthase
MSGGQVIDVKACPETLTISELTQMHQMKTGALISAALVTPALLCDASQDQISNLQQLGHHLGLLFQITDDILDMTSSTQTLGKTPLKDISDNKATYYTILGLAQSQKRAESEFKRAIDIINAFSNSELLIEITNQIYNRQS